MAIGTECDDCRRQTLSGQAGILKQVVFPLGFDTSTAHLLNLLDGWKWKAFKI